MRSQWVGLLLLGAHVSAATGADASVQKQYELVTETVMPHLEENLRYATTRENRCVDTHDLSRAFPILRHVALADCALVKAQEGNGGAIYTLQCTGGHGTTGLAQWQFDANSIAGTLNVRLGGKNMTFYQRVTGRLIGACQDL